MTQQPQQQPQPTPAQQALATLDAAASRAPLTRAEHVAVQRAVNVLAAALAQAGETGEETDNLPNNSSFQ